MMETVYHFFNVYVVVNSARGISTLGSTEICQVIVIVAGSYILEIRLLYMKLRNK